MNYFLTILLLHFLGFSSCTKSPHIVFILADDLGWNDVGFHGSGDIKTPNIDALAYTGIILDRNYVNPICTPSRSALMTGKYPIHTGMYHNVIMAAEPWGLSLEEKILPQYLRGLGYRNHIVGKWHLGHYKIEYTPLFRGFESHFGFWTGHQDYYNHIAVERIISSSHWGHDMRRNLEPAWDLYGQYSTDIFTRESVRIINNHNKSQPLFLYLAPGAVHSANPFKPLDAPDETILKFENITNYQRRKFAAILSKLDDSVGEVVDALRKNSMLDNSVILFSTDNGGAADGFNLNCASNFPLRGTKANIWEGGVRGAGFIWTSMTKEPGRIYRGKFNIADWLPTLFGLAGGEKSQLPENIDGIDMWEVLNEDKPSPRVSLVHAIEASPQKFASVTQDNWKIVEGSNYHGNWDSWYSSSTWDLPYDIDEIIQSPAGQAATALGFNLTSERILHLRQSSRIDCGIKDSSLLECKPQTAPCLFNILADPCEYNNLAEKNPEILRKMTQILTTWKSTVVPPRNVPADRNANPSFFNNVWTNFGDYPPHEVKV